MSMEARSIVFQDNIHVLDWLQCRRTYTRPGHFLQRLSRLERNLQQHINRIALYTPPEDLEELLEPLRIHYASSWSPVNRLKELRIILDVPAIRNSGVRRARIREENHVCRTASSLAHVDKVVVQNIFYMDRNEFKARAPGRSWRLLDTEDDNPRLNDDLFEMVFTFFSP